MTFIPISNSWDNGCVRYAVSELHILTKLLGPLRVLDKGAIQHPFISQHHSDNMDLI